MFTEVSVPHRTIMTPGPVEVHPLVLRAMSTSTTGQFDPVFLKYTREVQEMLQLAFQAPGFSTLAVDGSSRAGIEASLIALIEPGDKVLIPTYGRFAYLLVEIAERAQAEVITLDKDPSQSYDQEVIIEKIKATQPKIVAMNHGETANGQYHAVDKIGAYCQKNDIFFVVDTVATFAGMPVKQKDWGIDIAIAGTQKCLSVPAGLSLISMSPRATEYITGRYQKELGMGTDARNIRFIQSNYLDLSQLLVYWSDSTVHHHTEATNMIYGLHTGLRIFVQDQGLEATFKRHAKNAHALEVGFEAMGLALYGESQTRLKTVIPVEVPNGVGADEGKAFLLNQYGIEIAGSFGDLNGKVWRIGNMGYSSRQDNILVVLGAFEAMLTFFGIAVDKGAAVQAALEVYMSDNE